MLLRHQATNKQTILLLLLLLLCQNSGAQLQTMTHEDTCPAQSPAPYIQQVTAGVKCSLIPLHQNTNSSRSATEYKEEIRDNDKSINNNINKNNNGNNVICHTTALICTKHVTMMSQLYQTLRRRKKRK